MDEAKIKRTANELADMCIGDSGAFAKRYCELWQRGEYSEDELMVITKLSDVYAAAKQGYMTREEARVEQNRILRGGI